MNNYITPELWEHFNIKTFDINKTNQVYDLILRLWNENKELRAKLEGKIIQLKLF